MNEFITIIENVGFPIFIAIFMIVRLDQHLNRIEQELQTLNSRLPLK
jgi:hypothetical protein